MFIDTGDLDGPERMVVDPDKLVQLKQGIQHERDRISRWLLEHGRRLSQVKPPGGDPCSRHTAEVLSQNGGVAVAKGSTYVARLDAVVNKMHESVLTYGAIEDEATATFRQGPV